MSAPDQSVIRLLDRMLQASQENVDSLVGGVQRVARELSSLSFSYNTHLIRSGLRDASLSALDAQLDDASALLSRTLFDLQRRLMGDVLLLRPMMRIFEAANLEDERSPVVRLRESVDLYCTSLEREHRGMTETLGMLGLRLRTLANNIEIAACRAGGESASAPVELFCTMASHLRGLADRLRSVSGDLRIFAQTQNGTAESLRIALSNRERGEAA